MIWVTAPMAELPKRQATSGAGDWMKFTALLWSFVGVCPMGKISDFGNNAHVKISQEHKLKA